VIKGKAASAMDVIQAWRDYRSSGDPCLRQRILNHYLPLVRNVAGRLAMGFPKSVELTDLVNTGVIGLIEAFANFDPTRGIKFETYAVPRIRGAILDELRSLDWVPRSTRAKSRELDRASFELEGKLGRKPSQRELARHMNVTMDEFATTLGDVSGASLLSLDELIYREEDNRQVPRVETLESIDRNSVLAEIEDMEMRSYLSLAISNLSEQEKLVIALYYYEELTLKEIGEVMQISESRVSQIHTKAVMKLRNLVKEKFAM
jgi:RNA polymerase sigma factor for flagellar operon FliA